MPHFLAYKLHFLVRWALGSCFDKTAHMHCDCDVCSNFGPLEERAIGRCCHFISVLEVKRSIVFLFCFLVLNFWHVFVHQHLLLDSIHFSFAPLYLPFLWFCPFESLSMSRVTLLQKRVGSKSDIYSSSRYFYRGFTLRCEGGAVGLCERTAWALIIMDSRTSS